MNVVAINPQINRRTECIAKLVRSGGIKFATFPVLGGVFTVSNELARSFIIDTQDSRFRVGFPNTMRDIALSTWAGWDVLYPTAVPMKGEFSTVAGDPNHALVLVGADPDRDFSFQFRLPLSAELNARLTRYRTPLLIGVLDIDYTKGAYSIIDTLSCKKTSLP